jgi:hypothetical protein
VIQLHDPVSTARFRGDANPHEQLDLPALSIDARSDPRQSRLADQLLPFEGRWIRVLFPASARILRKAHDPVFPKHRLMSDGARRI